MTVQAWTGEVESAPPSMARPLGRAGTDGIVGAVTSALDWLGERVVLFRYRDWVGVSFGLFASAGAWLTMSLMGFLLVGQGFTLGQFSSLALLCCAAVVAGSWLLAQILDLGASVADRGAVLRRPAFVSWGGILALALGRQMGLDQKRLDLLGIGALLHDVGKMRMPSEILNKPGKLTEKERAIMKQHVPLGIKILEQTGRLARESLEVVRCHHERYDGSGYVSGLQGERISQFGLIGAIADYYDAITSDRAYRDGMAAHTALRHMYQQRSVAFDPGLVEHFIRCIGIYPIGSIVAFCCAWRKPHGTVTCSTSWRTSTCRR